MCDELHFFADGFDSESPYSSVKENRELELVFGLYDGRTILEKICGLDESSPLFTEILRAGEDIDRLSSVLGVEDLSSIILSAHPRREVDFAFCSEVLDKGRYYLGHAERSDESLVSVVFEELEHYLARNKNRERLFANLVRILENSPVALCFYDSNFDSVFFNKRAKEAGFDISALSVSSEGKPFIESVGSEETKRYFRSLIVDFQWDGSHTGRAKYSVDITDSERAKLELKKSRNKIKKLHEIALKLSKADSEERVYDLIVEASQKILEFDVYSLDIVEGDFLVVKRVTNSVPDKGDDCYNKHEGIAGRTLREGKTLVFPDISISIEAKPKSSDYRSALSIPIGNFGVFQTISTELDAFDSEDVELAEILAAHGAEAINRIRNRGEITRLTYNDPLTGALSRNGLEKFTSVEIEKSIRHSVPLSLMMLDIDDFKGINDSFGHVYGDSVLSWLVESVRMIIRSTDQVIRWGGDEFLIVLPEVTLEGAESMAERILDHLKKRTIEERAEITVSIGITSFLGDGDDIDRMIHRADSALYEAKSKGKNRLHVFRESQS